MSDAELRAVEDFVADLSGEAVRMVTPVATADAQTESDAWLASTAQWIVTTISGVDHGRVFHVRRGPDGFVAEAGGTWRSGG